MFRAREPQRHIFSARNQYLDLIKPESFYALLAKHGEQLFWDYNFEDMYCEDNGRPCIPPSAMFNLMMLQMYENCSDYEAIESSRFDIRWLAVLDLQIGERLCGRSTLQEFRARVHLNEKTEDQFKAVLELAKRLGVLKNSPLTVALDTTPILGRGAVKDTYNLIADGIRKLAGVLARLDGQSPEQWAKSHDLSRYWEASSLKGEAKIDWSNDGERRVFLNGLVADAERLMLAAKKCAASASKEEAANIEQASALLRRLISQDTEPFKPGDPGKGRKKRAASSEPAAPAEEGTQASPTTKSPTTDSEQTEAASPDIATSPPPSDSADSSVTDSTATAGTGPANPEPAAPAEEGTQASPTMESSTTDSEQTEAASPDIATSPPPSDSADSSVTDSTATAGTEPANPEVNLTEADPKGNPAPQEASVETMGPVYQVPGSDVLSQMVQIRQGVAVDRTISAYDEDMRHGRKSASNLFNGHKLSVCVDTCSKLILSLDVIAGNASDNVGALELTKKAASNTGIEVQKALGDCVYGDGATRKDFDDAGIDLSAKMPSPPANDPFHKGRFILDLTNKIATCPTGQTTTDYDFYTHRRGVVERFCFPAHICQACPHKEACLRNSDEDRKRGRTIALHPQEELLQRARQRQATPAFREDIKARQVVEHRQARMVQLGSRQARYVGRSKTKFQMLMIAMVANLTLMAKAIFLLVLAIITATLPTYASLGAYLLIITLVAPAAYEAFQPLKNRGFRMAS